jgi:hypothetical protein
MSCSLNSRNPLSRRVSKVDQKYRPFTASKRIFSGALKSPLGKAGFCHIRNTSLAEVPREESIQVVGDSAAVCIEIKRRRIDMLDTPEGDEV